MSKLTAADFLPLLEDPVLTQPQRKCLIEDMPSILDAVSDYDDITTGVFTDRNELRFLSSVYERIYYNFVLYSEEWYKDSVRGRIPDTKPSLITYYENENKRTEEWWSNRKLHRDDDKPAQIAYFENGKKQSEIWLKNNGLHRDDDKPASIVYYKNGNRFEERWPARAKKPGKGKQPFYVRYNLDGTVAAEQMS